MKKREKRNTELELQRSSQENRDYRKKLFQDLGEITFCFNGITPEVNFTEYVNINKSIIIKWTENY
jgi:hypothetical protein